MQKRILCLIVVLLFAGGLVASAQTLNYGTFKPTKQMTISIETDLSGPPTKPATEDVVTPILRQKTGITAVPYPTPTNLGSSAGARVAAQLAGNNLPDIFTESYTPPQVDGQQVLVDNNAVWDFSDQAFLKKMFPNFTTRLNQYGSLDTWYANEQTYNNTHIRITAQIDPNALSKLMATQKGTNYQRAVSWKFGQYPKGLRDDILKQIFPKARSDAEQRQFFLKTFNYNNPTGASDPFADVPINSMDDLYNYLKKAKEVIDKQNLMDGAGRDTMIPAQLNQSNDNSNSIAWSNFSMYGYIWTEPPFRVADKVYYNFEEPWFKNVLAWWNKLYNEGLLDPELFVKKDSQLAEEATRGRFAVINEAWVMPARKFAQDNKLKYSYREIAAWWPKGQLKNTYNDSTNQFVTYFQHFNANIITKSVKEEDLPQVANWLDYHYSEEFDLLRSWGPPSFYTGTGRDRRFKPAYKDLENYQVYGISGGKDGPYYGITDYYAVAPAPGVTNWETHIGELTEYPYAPRYVYPIDRTRIATYDNEMLNAVATYYVSRNVNFIPQVGWTWSELNNIPTFAKNQYAWFGTHSAAIAKAIDGPTADFEKNYQAYMKLFRDNDYDAGMTDYQIKWKEIFDTYIAKYYKY